MSDDLGLRRKPQFAMLEVGTLELPVEVVAAVKKAADFNGLTVQEAVAQFCHDRVFPPASASAPAATGRRARAKPQKRSLRVA